MGKSTYQSMIGLRFGRLTVLERDHVGRSGSYFLCQCDCGNKTIVSGVNLKSGNTTSCGCKVRERKTDDMTGLRFGRLQVLGFSHMGPYGKSYWLCECDCGNETIVSRTHLLDGHVTSCGCWNRDSATIHGMSHEPLYHTWVSMRQRCQNERQKAYVRYGARHIFVCDEWQSFKNFQEWAMSNGYEHGLTIDRINNDDGYYPENCRWVDRITQANNTSTNRFITYNGDTHTIAEWARLFEIDYDLLRRRINRNDMRDFEEYFGE